MQQAAENAVEKSHVLIADRLRHRRYGHIRCFQKAAALLDAHPLEIVRKALTDLGGKLFGKVGQGIVLLRRQRRQTKRRGIALPHTGDDRLDRRAELPLLFLCQSPQKQDERFEEATADVFLIPDALFFIFPHHVPDDLAQLAAIVVKNSAGGGGLEAAVLKMQQIGVRHLTE